MMKYTKVSLPYICLLSSIFSYVNGYPVTTDDNFINKDEKRYPNGTVIGKYTYTDNDGNPIHVRYFADDASYGVELKSVKVVNSNALGTEKLLKYPLQITDHPLESILDPFTGLKDMLIFNKNVSLEPLPPYKNKAKGDLKNNGEFEIFLQNEFRAPEKYGKEKVKVYFDKDKRKTRNAHVDYDTNNYCNPV